MARRRGGGFGGQGSFANAGPGGGGGGGGGNAFNQGPTAAPARGGGGGGGGGGRGGGGNNPFNRQQQRRQQRRRQANRGGGGGGGGGDAAVDDGTGDGSDSQAAGDAFQDIDYRREAAKGYLSGAGIRFDSPVGQNATNWLNNRIDTMAEDYQGQQLLNPDLTYNDYLNQQLAGVNPAQPVVAPPATGNEDIMDTPVYKMGGKGKGKRKRKRLPMLPVQGQPDPTAATTAPTPVPVGVPANPAEVRARLQRDFEAGSPLQTGRDSRLWRAPHRVIQF